MKKIIVLAMCAALSSFGTSLTTGDNQTNESTSNARVWDLGGGLTMTVRGFELINSSFVTANTTHFGQNNIGLGICGSTESCNFNQWQLDNQDPGGRDFALFTFSKAVDLVNFKVEQTTQTYDSDWAWATSVNQLTDPTGMSIANVDGPLLSAGESDVRTISNANGIKSLLLGVGTKSDWCPLLSYTCDYFKLTDIEVSTRVSPTATPEPGSMALLGGGLVGLGIFARRRKRA